LSLFLNIKDFEESKPKVVPVIQFEKIQVVDQPKVVVQPELKQSSRKDITRFGNIPEPDKDKLNTLSFKKEVSQFGNIPELDKDKLNTTSFNKDISKRKEEHKTKKEEELAKETVNKKTTSKFGNLINGTKQVIIFSINFLKGRKWKYYI